MTGYERVLLVSMRKTGLRGVLLDGRDGGAVPAQWTTGGRGARVRKMPGGFIFGINTNIVKHSLPELFRRSRFAAAASGLRTR